MDLRSGVVIASLLLSACRISVPEGLLPCQSTQDCPVAWSCDRGRCTHTSRESQTQAEVTPALDAAVSSESQLIRQDAGKPADPPSIADEDAGSSGCEAKGCGCRDGETKPCYSGAAESVGRGRCAAGIATCKHGSFGACTDERLPGHEWS